MTRQANPSPTYSVYTASNDTPVALVTGGCGGIGAAIVEALRQTGARVMVHDRDDSRRPSSAQPGLNSERLGFVSSDISSAEGARTAVEGTVKRFGRLDAVVNNAAALVHARTLHVTEAAWDGVFSTNLKGSFFVAQAAAAHMRDQGGGRIINLASQLAHTGHPHMATYAASKAALVNLTRSLAKDLAPDNILVNAVCPGPTDTVMLHNGPDDLVDLATAMPIGRLLRPADIAMSVLFLLGPGGAAYTGQHLDPNGGIVMV